MSYLKRIPPAMIVAIVALILALSGGAYAATQGPSNSVGTYQLKDASVTNHKLLNGSIGPLKLNRALTAELAKHNATGATGARGTIGAAGAIGATGPSGTKGDPGAAGTNGTDGKDGVNGSNQPSPITAFGQTYGPGTFQEAAYGANSKTAELCAPNGRGNDPANVSDGTIRFAAPPSAAPLGSKALEMTSTGKTVDVYLPQDGCSSNELLSQVTSAAYSSLVAARDSADPGGNTDVTFQIELTHAATGTTSGYTTMVYEPYNNGQTGATNWTIHDVAHGKVWSTHALTTSDCTQAAPCPFSQFVADNPNALIGDVKFQVGQNSGLGWNGFDAYVDNVWFNGARYDLGG